MKKSIITTLLILVTLAVNAAVPDSIKQKLADFDTIVQVAEKDYAAFKFKVTDANRKDSVISTLVYMAMMTSRETTINMQGNALTTIR